MSSKKRVFSTTAITFFYMIFAVAVGAVIAVIVIKSPRSYNESAALHTVGLANPVANRLSERYADTDGDLVADAPAGPIESDASGS
jgi:Ni/Fe-hydrogenase subunit HybB-like protein